MCDVHLFGIKPLTWKQLFLQIDKDFNLPSMHAVSLEMEAASPFEDSRVITAVTQGPPGQGSVFVG